MVRLTTFPRGSAEGLVVLPLAPDTDPSVLEREGQWPGVWALQIDPTLDWSASKLLADASAHTLVAIIDIEHVPEQWPDPGPDYAWTVDASTIARAPNMLERLGALAWLPEIQDLWIELDADQEPPTAGQLTQLAGAVQPRCCYVYVPRDYQFHATLVRIVAQAAESWAIRWK